MTSTRPLGVLFVNVGWSIDYDGTILPVGQHGYLRTGRAQTLGSTEEALFVAKRGKHVGPIGSGELPRFDRLDVVYSARDPITHERFVVAVFRDCRVRHHHSTRGFLMATARREDVTCYRIGDRPPLASWPGRMGMRRWALGGPGENWPKLYAAYESLIGEPTASDGSAAELHDAAIFLVLGPERIDSLHYQTKSRWRAAEDVWAQARARNAMLPIVFGDATRDSGRLFRWARITRLDVSERGTNVSWGGVQPIRHRVASQLVKLSDGRPVARQVRRGYTVVRTPDFLIALAAPKTPFDALREADADPLVYEDTLRRIRRQQTKFKANLVAVYGGRCAISGVAVPPVLEAAHIDPHSRRGDNRTENGLLLRSDLHALFDEGLIRVAPKTLRIEVAPSLRATNYGEFHDVPLRERVDGRKPDSDALRRRWRLRPG